MPGDSVGPASGGPGGTLGPPILMGNKAHWLIPNHIVDHNEKGSPPDVDQPSRLDMQTDRERGLDSAQGRNPRRLGRLVACSGISPTMTTRVATDKSHMVVTDWALVYAKIMPCVPILPRVFDCQVKALPEDFFQKISKTFSGSPAYRPVYAAGRSSGITFGRVAGVRMLCRHVCGTKTMEWYVERDEYLSQACWDERGMGTCGDSGAMLVDMEDNHNHSVVGMVFGNGKATSSKAKRKIGRIAVFSHIQDIFADIEEQCNAGKPELLTIANGVVTPSQPPDEDYQYPTGPRFAARPNAIGNDDATGSATAILPSRSRLGATDSQSNISSPTMRPDGEPADATLAAEVAGVDHTPAVTVSGVDPAPDEKGDATNWPATAATDDTEKDVMDGATPTSTGTAPSPSPLQSQAVDSLQNAELPVYRAATRTNFVRLIRQMRLGQRP